MLITRRPLLTVLTVLAMSGGSAMLAMTPASAANHPTAHANAFVLTHIPRNSPGKPAQVDECLSRVGISPVTPSKVLRGYAYHHTCTGVRTCFQTADLQMRSPTDPDSWFTIKDGRQEAGCTSAHASVVGKSCLTSKEYYAYRTLGIMTVDWSDGTVTGPVDEYSPSITTKFLC
jgi:hypothetical protein